jgi:hypothetical protein
MKGNCKWGFKQGLEGKMEAGVCVHREGELGFQGTEQAKNQVKNLCHQLKMCPWPGLWRPFSWS